jgi:hypothetical protein
MAKNKLENAASNQVINLPYLNAYGNINRALEGIKKASTPARFTQDFLSTKLGLSGGGATPVIPFLKRTGFLNGDGTPTDLYKEFRNDALSSACAAQAVRIGYAPLYEINEYTHDLNDTELKGVVVQATGLDASSKAVKAIIASFKAIRGFADFDATPSVQDDEINDDDSDTLEKPKQKKEGTIPRSIGMQLGYTINLNLPATSDIAVFDAIFKSLRKHLLDE